MPFGENLAQISHGAQEIRRPRTAIPIWAARTVASGEPGTRPSLRARMDALDRLDLLDYTRNMSSRAKVSAKTVKKARRKTARLPAAGDGTAIYQVTAPAVGQATLVSFLRERFGGHIEVEEVGRTRTKMSIRQGSAAELAALEASNVEQEFAARNVLLARARPVDEVRKLLSIRSRQTLHNWIAQGKIIALPDNGRLLLPLWQFDAGAGDKVVAGFPETLRALKRSSFSAAHWFTNPNVQLGNKTPIALLRAGKIEKVIAEAELADTIS